MRGGCCADGCLNVRDYGAVGNGVDSDTAAIMAAIAALPSSGGMVFFPPGTFMCQGVTFSKNSVTLVGAGAATILRKNAHGTLLTIGAGGGTKNALRDVTLDGNGATFTGDGLAVGGTFPWVDSVDIRDTNGYAMTFGPGLGHSAMISNCILRSATQPAVYLPLDTGAPNRGFVNCHSDGTVMFRDDGSQNTKWTGCTMRNVDIAGDPGKLFMTGCRIASVGAETVIRGTSGVVTGCVFAGPVRLAAAANEMMVCGVVIAGGLTIDAGATHNVIGPLSLTGSIADNSGLSTNRIV